jgi:hypothetical protein
MTFKSRVRRLHAPSGLTALFASVLLAVVVAPASAAGTVGWNVRSAAEPSAFSPDDVAPSGQPCQTESAKHCDWYTLFVMNVGNAPSSGAVVLTDTLPPGITARRVRTGEAQRAGQLNEDSEGNEEEWACTIGVGGTTVTCTFENPVGAALSAPSLLIEVSSPSYSSMGPLRNQVSVSGGGATRTATTVEETAVVSEPLHFGSDQFNFALSEFSVEPEDPNATLARQAGGHPTTFTTSFAMPSATAPESELDFASFDPAQSLRSVAVELPLGFAGNPQAIPRCDLAGAQGGRPLADCPQDTAIGTWDVRGGFFSEDYFRMTGAFPGVSPIYNIAPQGPYPAEFALSAVGHTVFLYPSVIHDASGYRLRVASSDLPTILQLNSVELTFFGVPGEINGSGSNAALLTSPENCSDGPLTSRISVESWESPGRVITREATAYPQVTGCDSVSFEPSLSLAPSAASDEGTSQADEPSGFDVSLKQPQATQAGEPATGQLKDATVTLPPGVSISPSAAQGLVGCEANGPDGFDIPTAGVVNIAGEGEEIGADGFAQMAPGHCPAASTLGTASVYTPLLPDGPNGAAPLRGHLYLAQPRCGGAGQPECTEASATNGELYGLYLEANDPAAGVVIKLAGTVAADPATGQLTASFKENPQLPFSELKLHLHGGPRAPLANPQTCGTYAASSVLSSWSGQVASEASASFSADWDGNGGACPASLPFAPGFAAGTVVPSGGAFSPFTLRFSRQDREQDLAGLAVTLPPGLLATLSQVPLCGEPQAAQGACPAASQIGTTTVTAGAGPSPLALGGQVYLTSSYRGAPFGLSIVVPANAGPFHLGDVVVRAAISVNPATAAITVTSDSLPQSKDGVPFRLRMVDVTVDRPAFIFNPTNCAQQRITGTISAAQGASLPVSSPFAVAGCARLPFKPTFTATTQGRTSKASGASLTVKVSEPSGNANIQKVDVQLPLELPSRLTTLQRACTAAQFAANPAGCPPESNVGTAVAHTPVLPVALEGPAYLVSHGGAAFPDLVVVLQGDGVVVDLTGNTNIKKGITYSNFDTVPDAPISSFELKLPQRPFSVLAAIGSLCKPTRTVTVRRRVAVRRHGRTVHVLRSIPRRIFAPLAMPTKITAQNGAVFSQRTAVTVQGCPRPAVKKSAKKVRRTGKANIPAKSRS